MPNILLYRLQAHGTFMLNFLYAGALCLLQPPHQIQLEKESDK